MLEAAPSTVDGFGVEEHSRKILEEDPWSQFLPEVGAEEEPCHDSVTGIIGLRLDPEHKAAADQPSQGAEEENRNEDFSITDAARPHGDEFAVG